VDESTLNDTTDNTQDRSQENPTQKNPTQKSSTPRNPAENSSTQTDAAEPAPAVRKRRLVAPTSDDKPDAPEPGLSSAASTAAATPQQTKRKRAVTAPDKPASGSHVKSEPKAKSQTRGKSEPKGRTKSDPASSESELAKPPVPPVPPPARKPQIGDSRPAPGQQAGDGDGSGGRRRRRRGGRGRGGRSRSDQAASTATETRNGSHAPVEAILADQQPLELDDEQLTERRGKYRNGKPLGRYRMCVHVSEGATHIAVLEGRSLIEYYVSRPSDDISEIYGNLYMGRVRRVLPGMEAAFVDIGTPKQAVLYRGDLTVASDDSDEDASGERKRAGGRRGRNVSGPAISDLISNGQTIMCQVIKNPIGHKGARLTTEVSLPGRFVVLIPGSSVTGISRRLPSRERRRLRSLLAKEIPEGFGVILRTAAENVTPAEIRRDIERLTRQWTQISELSKRSDAPALLFREPELAVRIIREQFTADFREVVIDDPVLFDQVKGYMEAVAAPLMDRIRYYDPVAERLPLFERSHVAEQVRKATDRKVWLPSGGSLIIEHTEALTVIDVNTGRNVGRSSLNETLFQNNLEAATEIAKQLRLRDIGGIIVVDFVDMDDKRQREQLMNTLNEALARDKTRTATEPISDMGIVQMTRMRTGEGLLESMSDPCDECEGRGIQLRESLFA